MTYFKKLNNSNEGSNYSSLYSSWLNYVKTEKTGYFSVSNGITSYLPLIKSPAINLYLYYCYRADNDKGDSFASIERIADDLGVSKKTINNWNSTLLDLGLILRIDKAYKSTTTQLLPVSDFIMDIANDANIDVTSMQKTLINQLGYKRKTSIAIVLLNSDPQKITYYDLFSRTYTASAKNKEQKQQISRFIALTTSTELIAKGDSWPKSKDEWSYYDQTDNKINLVLLTTKNISNNDILEILKDLQDTNRINNFKTVYPKYVIKK